VYMNTAVINIRTDVEIKKQAQMIAKELGISLSSLINGFVRNLVRTKRVEFDLIEERPSEYMIKTLRESEADFDKGDYNSFDSADKAVGFLEKNID
jgi:DNA-damage-inducible protein J